MHWRHSEGIPKQLPFFPPVQPIFFQHQRLQHWTAVTVGNASSSERQPIVGRGDVIEYQSRRSRHQKLIQVERALHTCRFFTSDDNIFADNNFEKYTLSYNFPLVHRNTDKARLAFLQPAFYIEYPCQLPVSSPYMYCMFGDNTYQDHLR